MKVEASAPVPVNKKGSPRTNPEEDHQEISFTNVFSKKIR